MKLTEQQKKSLQQALNLSRAHVSLNRNVRSAEALQTLNAIEEAQAILRSLEPSAPLASPQEPHLRHLIAKAA